MLPKHIARLLSNIQRNCLIDHVPGPQPFHTNTHRQTKQSLVDLKLLGPLSGILPTRPAELKLTELGRETVCIILGQYADALVSCGVLHDPLTEIELQSAIRESTRRKPPCQIKSPAAAENAAVSVQPTAPIEKKIPAVSS
jgi:hypothetical protein